jgi:hypothetical protein
MLNHRLSIIFMFLLMGFCCVSPSPLLGKESKPVEIPSFEETCALHADDPSSAFLLYSNKQIATTVTVGEKVKNLSICMNNEDMFTAIIFAKPGYAVGCICNSNDFKALVTEINPGDVISLQGEYQSIENKDFNEKGLICYITLSGCSFKLDRKKGNNQAGQQK